MRIDRLLVQNFKCFEDQEFSFHPKFNLLIGENGAGKTAILEAAAVAARIWMTGPATRGGGRFVYQTDIRKSIVPVGGFLQFVTNLPVRVEAHGEIGGELASWTYISADMSTSLRLDASKRVRDIIERTFDSKGGPEQSTLPLLAYYSAGRVLPPGDSSGAASVDELRGVTRYHAYDGAWSGQIAAGRMHNWFYGETAAAGSRGGRFRPGMEVVRKVILECIPECDLLSLEFITDLGEIAVRIDGDLQPFSNLSAGRKMMVALVADLAIRAVTLNAHLLPPDELGPEDDPIPRVLRETPGVVLIDELDVHLHPAWQRRIASDLKRLFPSVQFICTTHSPQIIGELPREEIIDLEQEKPSSPHIAFGADSNWILDHVMGASSRNEGATKLIEKAKEKIDRDELQGAKQVVEELRAMMNGEDGELVRLESSIDTLEALGRADD